VVSDDGERPAMLELHKTYGKTVHTWSVVFLPDERVQLDKTDSIGCQLRSPPLVRLK